MDKFTAFVCYFDLLGTKSRFLEEESTEDIQTRRKCESEIDRLGLAHRIMKKTLGFDSFKDEDSANRSRVFFFSDGGLVVEETEAYPNGKAKTDNESTCCDFLQDIADCQFELIRAGFLVRGYATVGMVGTANDFAAGPAVCKAVEREQTVEGPFVQIDEELLRFVYKGYYRGKLGHKGPEDELFGTETWNDFFVLENKTGAIFLNHMHNWNCSDFDTEEALIRQKGIIEVNGPKNSQSAKKYLALAAFHNQMTKMMLPAIAVDPGKRFLVSEELFSMLGQQTTPSLSNASDKLKSICDEAHASILAERKELR